MALPADPPIHNLPDELLLQIASHLTNSATPRSLKNLCLTSRKFRAAGQEVLHTVAKLSSSCGCHPKVNPLLRLLRTLLDRADLATQVKTLHFRTVRKNVAKLCEEQAFSLAPLRTRSLAKLEDLGYKKHTWHKTIQNSIESGFAGVLLVILPNLTQLEFWVKDHYRGPPSSECVSGLFGGMSVPDSIISGWSTLRHLTSSDTHLLKSGINLASLTSLDLKTISIGTVLRLNGPGCLEGAENLQDLALTVSIQFADRLLIEKADIQFGDLFEALSCNQLRALRIILYHIGDDRNTQLEGGYFIDQLNSMRNTLETLAITLETTEDDSELEWLLEMITSPKDSLDHFTVLKNLVLPQAFIFAVGSVPWEIRSCRPRDLPPKLEMLGIFYPGEEVEDWVAGFVSQHTDDAKSSPLLKEITLTCRDEVGAPASYFSTDVNDIWWELATYHGIDAYTFCQIQEHKSNLAKSWYEESLGAASRKQGQNGAEGERNDGTDGDRADDCEKMADLINVADDLSESIETVD
ncbi:hypothetical protein G6011_01229 [Alternaria panax]|uniref:F-box domain-containing protein n=1 Tax=Alternaria panax TaxID=48097 RepID=A0AAD4IKI8_9PLEO|nr:hypothetical protein G6011_01229 [Alternaria panax]